MTNRCPVCGSIETLLIRERVVGGKVKKGADVKVRRCEGCDLDFLESWEDVPKVHSWYSGDNYVYVPDEDKGPPPKFHSYKAYLREVEPYLKADARVLDVGCGDGTFLRAVRDRVGYIQGVEITTAHVARLRSEGIPVWDQPLHECIMKEPFDIVVMHAFLEHVPRVGEFLQDLKRFIHRESSVFIAVPHGLDPLASYYEVSNYRDHFYREYHLYYFTEKSLGNLLQNSGYDFELTPYLAASLTNHFHWVHQGKGQKGSGEYTNVVLPQPLRRDSTPKGLAFSQLLERVDDFYRKVLQEAGVGDMLHCRAWLKR